MFQGAGVQERFENHVKEDNSSRCCGRFFAHKESPCDVPRIFLIPIFPAARFDAGVELISDLIDFRRRSPFSACSAHCIGSTHLPRRLRF